MTLDNKISEIINSRTAKVNEYLKALDNGEPLFKKNYVRGCQATLESFKSCYEAAKISDDCLNILQRFTEFNAKRYARIYNDTERDTELNKFALACNSFSWGLHEEISELINN